MAKVKKRAEPVVAPEVEESVVAAGQPTPEVPSVPPPAPEPLPSAELQKRTEEPAQGTAEPVASAAAPVRAVTPFMTSPAAPSPAGKTRAYLCISNHSPRGFRRGREYPLSPDDPVLAVVDRRGRPVFFRPLE